VNPRTRTVAVDSLARVEGQGGLRITIDGSRVTSVQMNIFEPPRFFEAMLRGRDCSEAPDITSRICGICPIAYQTSAIAAVEDCLGIRVPPAIQTLRRLVYCGEWISSHAFHVYLLHAPDFLGFDSGFHMAREHPAAVERGLRLKKVGNDLMSALGGREIHPINLRVGGFFSVPSRAALQPLADQLAWAADAAEETVRWVSGFEFPDIEADYEFVSLRAADGSYPIESGSIVSSRGLSLDVRDYEQAFVEHQVPHSTALQSTRKADAVPLLSGALARMNLNFERLTPRVREAARAAAFSAPCRNPYRSIVARALEILYACEEASRILATFERPEEPAQVAPRRAGVGCGATEAPRGTLYQRYELNTEGLIESANIVPPTARNQRAIEHDLRELVERHLKWSKSRLERACEHAIRNHDPCISCATHFIKIQWEGI
jgi:coenzyme F420-reducing hydrogenase alpha subunit